MGRHGWYRAGFLPALGSKFLGLGFCCLVFVFLFSYVFLTGFMVEGNLIAGITVARLVGK